MKIVRYDYWDRPGADWICRGPEGKGPLTSHVFEDVSILHGTFKILRCTGCGLIDGCGVPQEYLDLVANN